MTRIPRTLDRRRKSRRAPQLPAGHERVYQVFDETHRFSKFDEAFTRMLDAAAGRETAMKAARDVSWREFFANDSIGAASRRLMDEYRRSSSPASQQVASIAERLYLDGVILPHTYHACSPHPWGAETTPGCLQHAPQPADALQPTNNDTPALAAASPSARAHTGTIRQPAEGARR